MGGVTADNSGTLTTVTQVDAYDFSAKTWATNVADIGTGTSNVQFPAVVAGPANDVFFLGGKSCIQGCGQNPYLSEIFDFATATSMFDKTTNPPMPYHVSAAGAVVPGDGNLYVLMGECNGYSCPTPADLNSVQTYSIAGK